MGTSSTVVDFKNRGKNDLMFLGHDFKLYFYDTQQ